MSAQHLRGGVGGGGGGGGGGMRRTPDDFRTQLEDMKERNRILRSQLQAVQSEKDKALETNRRHQENSKVLWKKADDYKRELEKTYASQRGQVSRFDHEKLAKRYDQIVAQLRIVQHDKERLEQFQRQEVDGRFMEDLKSIKLSLEEVEQDRDSVKYKLSEKKREVDRLHEQLACLGPEQEASKKEIEKILKDRDSQKARLNELKQEKQKLHNNLLSANKTIESLKSKTPISDKVSELQAQVVSLQQTLEAMKKDKSELLEANNDLKRSLEISEHQCCDADNECQRLRHAIAELRGMSPNGRASMNTLSQEIRLKNARGRSQGSTEEDFVMSSDSENPSSLTGLTALSRSSSGHINNLPGGGGASGVALTTTHSGGEIGPKLGKFSSSTSNLSNNDRSVSSSSLQNRLKTTRLEKALEETKRENANLNLRIAEFEHEKSEVDVQMKDLKKNLEDARTELAKTSGHFKVAKSQIDMLHKEKGVALRDNAASFEQSVHLETQLRELMAEKQIFDQQKEISKKEMDRVITESVTNKKKLEAIKAQRQKDGNELSAMRHIKDKAMQEAKELKKRLDDIQKSKITLDEEMVSIRETVHRMTVKLSPHTRQKGQGGTGSSLLSRNGGGGESGGVSQELKGIVEHLHSLENERKVIMKRIYGTDVSDQGYTLGDILHKIDSIFQQRDDIMVELEALQQSSMKLSEDRIYELKQKLEDTLMENDGINGENKRLKREVNSLSTLLVKVEQERDKVSVDCERLDLKCQHFKQRESRLVEEHARTLEKVTELWKQKWPVNWDEAWEEKHVSVPLDGDGFAGFSVVGGRDQPQLPNPGAFIITVVNQGGPAEGILRAGDVLEFVNGVNLSNADHREAVRAVKETKRNLSIVLKRRRNAYPINVGIVQPINAVPQLTQMASNAEPEKTEQIEFSLYITGKEKSDLGFHYDWSTVCTVADVTASGPADQILEHGDRIIKVNNTIVTREKPSAIKKMMKPHKNILRLTIERPSNNSNKTYMGQPQLTNSSDPWPSNYKSDNPSSSSSFPYIHENTSWPSSNTTSNNGSISEQPGRPNLEGDYTQQSLTSHGSYSTLDRIGPESERVPNKETYGMQEASNFSHYKSRSRDSYSSSRDSREDYSQDTQSQDSSTKPTKLVSRVTCVKKQPQDDYPQKPSSIPATRPSSDGVIYGKFNERRIEYEEVLLSERSDSQYSQSESYLSESSYDYGLSSSQSIDLTFHTVSSMPAHNSLTVDTVTQTQAPSQHSEDEDGVGFLARDDASRTTFKRSRNPNDISSSNSKISHSEDGEDMENDRDSSQLSGSQNLSQEFNRDQKGHRIGIRRRMKRHQKSNSVNGSRSLSNSKSTSDQNLSRGSSNLAMWGRSRSNLSLGRAPSMTSVAEEPRRASSTADMFEYEHDPLADAIYIRANFTYIPTNPKELAIKSGDVFHIHDETLPGRFRSSFWVSRLNADGTDEQVGAIPNSMRAQDYLGAQGESLDFSIYEEVEAFTGSRPVVIFGVLADQVVTALLESFPKLFYQCPTDRIEGAVRLTEARLRRELTEGKIIDFIRTDGGFEVIRLDAIKSRRNKSKHCLMIGSIQALQVLKTIAPPITILVKAMTEESITTFSPEQISSSQAKEIYDEVTHLEDTHGNEFSSSLFLIYMETLMGQIENIINIEKRKQAWVPISRPQDP